MPPTMSHPRPVVRQVLVGGVVVALLVVTAIGAGWRAHAANASTANDARERQAEGLIGNLDSTIADRLAQLGVAGSFIESSYPTEPAAFARYMASYRMSTNFTDLSLGALIIAVRVDELPALEAQEQVWDPWFRVTGTPPGATGLRYVMLRAPEGMDLLGGSIVGVDVTDVVARIDLDAARGSDHPWLFSMADAATALDGLTGTDASGSAGMRRFFRSDLLAVQELRRADGGLLGLFLVPVRMTDLIAGRNEESMHVRVALLDPQTSEERVSTELRGFDGTRPLASRMIDPQQVAWRVDVYDARPPASPMGIDVSVLVTVLLGGLGLAGLADIVRRIVVRRRTLLAELDETSRQAITDHLTGVRNRSGLERALGDMLGRPDGGRVYVMLLDLDRFKLVNDTQGHEAGDALLRTVAARMRAVAGRSGIVARFGGDEFVYVTDAVADDLAALAFADRFAEALGEPMPLGDGEHVTSASIGVACAIAGTGAVVGHLLRDADVAIYHAKRDPNARCAIFDEGMRHAAMRFAEVEQDLRAGLRRGEIVPFFQPVFDREGALVAFEALARWMHPDRGLLAPAQFLDVAVSVGAVPDLDAQILRRSVEEAASWNRDPADPPIAVFVNLQDDVLRSPRFVDEVRAALDAVGLDPGLLTLEVPEELLLAGAPHELDGLRQIAALGVNLAIDDFGRGRSSLLSLADFDMISVLKLDLEFVRKLPLHEPTRSVFCAVRDVAHSLGMSVVAEGVETTSEARVLRNLGIDYVQGFLYGHPIPKARVAELLREARRGERVVVDLRRL